jgi:predicted chitinase
MAKKKTYSDYLREELGGLVEQLQLPDLYKQSLKRRWLDQVIWADKKADQCRRWHYRLRLTTIIGGVILPALVGLNLQLAKDNAFFRDWFPYVPFTLSQVIAVSAALEEFYRNGDRWRDYRKMSENLKTEGWQYLQLSGSYDNLLSHMDGYAMFASRVESVIKDDVQNYIAALAQQQALQEQQVQQLVKDANAVATDKNLFAKPEPKPEPVADASSNGKAATMTAVAPAAVTVNAAAGSAGSLKVKQDTVFKLSPQPSDSLPDDQKVTISNGSTLGLFAYTNADNNHLKVTLTQGLGADNCNTWHVYAPHAEILGNHGQPVANPVAAKATPTTTAAPTPAIATSDGSIKLAVPYFSQRDNMEEPLRTCNTSSCAMVAKFLGAKISGDDDYYRYVIKHGDTTDHGAQTQALAELGIKSTWNTALDLDDLDKSLASGLPVVIGILHHGPLETPSGGGHMIVVIGRTANGDYIVNDPFGSVLDGYATENGGGLIYSRNVIAHRWTVEGKNSGWGRLLYGNPSPATSVAPAISTAPATTTANVPQRITAEQLIQIAGSNAPKDRLRQLTPGLNQTLDKYQINTPLRIAHFLAQVAHESDCFNAMEEYADGSDYEGRDDLGNIQPGDGVRFKGRGLVQLTGRANYKSFSSAMGQDFIAQPTLVAQPPYAILVAGWFWDNKTINPVADRDDVEAVTRIVNGGLNGIEDRRSYLQAAKSVLKC